MYTCTDAALDKMSSWVSIECLDVCDAFMKPFINRGLNTQSFSLGAIGGMAFGAATCVSIIVRPIIAQVPEAEFIHQFTRGVIVRAIFTSNKDAALFGGSIYVVAEALNIIFRKIIPESGVLKTLHLEFLYNQIPQEWPAQVFATFHIDFIVRSGIRGNMLFGFQDALVGGAARGAALIIKKFIKIS